MSSGDFPVEEKFQRQVLADSREFCTKVFYITHVHWGFFKADVTTVKKKKSCILSVNLEITIKKAAYFLVVAKIDSNSRAR